MYCYNLKNTICMYPIEFDRPKMYITPFCAFVFVIKTGLKIQILYVTNYNNI